MAIYRFSKWRQSAIYHLGIVLPPYETTHEVFVADRSCLSNFMSIWYTDLKIYLFEFFWHIWLEMPIQALKMGFLGDFGVGPLNVIIHHRDPQIPKGTSVRKCASFKLSTVKTRWRAWPVNELTQSVIDTHTLVVVVVVVVVYLYSASRSASNALIVP